MADQCRNRVYVEIRHDRPTLAESRKRQGITASSAAS